MKKYFTILLLAFFAVAVISCNDRDDNYVGDGDTYPVALDIINENFTIQNGSYRITKEFTSPLVASDVVLIYRKAGESNGNPVWQAIPRTIYLSEGREFDYDFDFTRNDIAIYADGNYDIATTPEYLNGQTFRVILVPASTGGKNSAVNYDDYESVIKFYNIDESKIKPF